MEEREFDLIAFTDKGFSLDVRVGPDGDTVWLTTTTMALLFDRDRLVISRHIKSIYKEGELSEKVPVHFLHAYLRPEKGIFSIEKSLYFVSAESITKGNTIMFDKRLLIVPALVVSTVVAGTIYLSSDQKASPLATEAASIQYSATIDVAHPLRTTNSNGYYAFGLHNAGAYGGLFTYDGGTLSTSLSAGYENYAFSWTAPASKPFQIYFNNWNLKCEVGGVGEVSTLWGIPNARKVELVYNKGGASYSISARPIGNWNKTSEETDSKTKDVTVTYEDTNSPGDNSYWSVSMEASSTIYIRSITIWYLC